MHPQQVVIRPSLAFKKVRRALSQTLGAAREAEMRFVAPSAVHHWWNRAASSRKETFPR